MKAAGAARRLGGDKRPAGLIGPGTNGGLFGLSGDDRRVLGYGWLGFAGVVLAVGVIDVITTLHEAPRIPVIAPIVWEGTSALVTLVLILGPFLLVRWARSGASPLWLVGAVILALAPLYSLAHVGGFLALRKGLYALAGQHYRYGPLSSALPYEMSKDVLAYAGELAVFWLNAHLLAQGRATPPPAPATAQTFDIVDGARVLRVAVGDILAVTSAGNYAEFQLADGRRPLMRVSLASLEAELATHGFLRIHRSWLINAARVTALTPEGSGDYAVALGTLTAPLSRRFPEALAKLRKA